MRFGLVGTGFWATTVHGPGLLGTPGAELVGVWGRDPEKTDHAAGRLGIEAYRDPSALFAEVDAVTFAVPPDVQAPLAVHAAGLGKHLLLEKPTAGSAPAADALARQVTDSGVASVVFLTDRYSPETRAWLAELDAAGGWRGGWVRM